MHNSRNFQTSGGSCCARGLDSVTSLHVCSWGSVSGLRRWGSMPLLLSSGTSVDSPGNGNSMQLTFPFSGTFL